MPDWRHQRNCQGDGICATGNRPSRRSSLSGWAQTANRTPETVHARPRRIVSFDERCSGRSERQSAAPAGLVDPSTPRDRPRSMVRTRPSRSPNLSTASSPRLAPESAARRTRRSPCSALKSSRCSPGECGSVASAIIAFWTLSSADRRAVGPRSACGADAAGVGRGRACPPRIDRRTPSLTAQDSAERRTNQRADTVDTEWPADCHRQIAARTSPVSAPPGGAGQANPQPGHE